MEQIKRFLARRPKNKETGLVLPDKLKSEGEQVGELEGLAGLIKKGHPQQHDIAKVMAGKIREQVASREAGNEREPQYQTDIKILVKTERGHVIGTSFKKDRYKIALRRGEFSRKQVCDALSQTYPDMEVYREIPSFFPRKWLEGQNEPFLGLRLPINPPFGEARALWLMVNEHSSYSENFNIFSSEGQIEDYYFAHDSLYIEAEPEIKHQLPYKDPDYRPIDGSDQAWYTSIYHMPEGMPQLIAFQNKFGDFLEKLLPEDKVKELGVWADGWDVPMGLEEAKKYPNFHSVAQEKTVWFQGAEISESAVPTNKYGSEKYVFETGLNEYGILEQRPSGYVIPYIYTRVRIEPLAFPFSQLNAEIERMRVV